MDLGKKKLEVCVTMNELCGDTCRYLECVGPSVKVRGKSFQESVLQYQASLWNSDRCRSWVAVKIMLKNQEMKLNESSKCSFARIKYENRNMLEALAFRSMITEQVLSSFTSRRRNKWTTKCCLK